MTCEDGFAERAMRKELVWRFSLGSESNDLDTK
jgi:hypothetical protein